MKNVGNVLQFFLLCAIIKATTISLEGEYFMPQYTGDASLFWKKKEYISFLLSILVIFVHMSTFSQYGEGEGAVTFINDHVSYLLKESLTRFAVPMFFILSGIAFYKDYDNKQYVRKIKSRVSTLVIPYLLWNTIWMLFDIVCSYTFISNFFVGRKPFELTAVNVLLAIFLRKRNLPFWFILDLILFAVAAPLIHLLIRNKYVGIASAAAIAVLAHFGIGLPNAVFYSATAILFYMIGAIIGKHFFGLVAKKARKGLQWGSLAFLVLYVIMKNLFPPAELTSDSLLTVTVYVLCAFALWNTVDLFIDRIKPRALYRRSFAIFAIHMNLSAIITKLILILVSRDPWFAIPNFVLSVVLTVLIINYTCAFMERFTPGIYGVLMGNRTRKKKGEPTPA
jgi:hypothetical protein